MRGEWASFAAYLFKKNGGEMIIIQVLAILILEKIFINFILPRDTNPTKSNQKNIFYPPNRTEPYNIPASFARWRGRGRSCREHRGHSVSKVSLLAIASFSLNALFCFR